MAMSFDQAEIFGIAGFDIRHDDMPSDDFVRWHDQGVTPLAPEGYGVRLFNKQTDPVSGFKWRMA